jgi:hypothetical protein
MISGGIRTRNPIKRAAALDRAATVFSTLESKESTMQCNILFETCVLGVELLPKRVTKLK